jgi:RNA polymerase sigma-70 factor (ECF subfamily)
MKARTPDESDRARDEYAALVRAAAGGDEAAMERLLVRAQEVAYRFSLLVCGHVEDAEDVMQEALLRTYAHVREIENPDAFRTWLYTTVRNACLMKRRRRAGEPSRFAPLDQAGVRPQAEVPADPWIDRRLHAALAALPASQRAIVVLREIEGLSTREVATVTGISEDNVKTRLHRARVMLRKKLQDV